VRARVSDRSAATLDNAITDARNTVCNVSSHLFFGKEDVNNSDSENDKAPNRNDTGAQKWHWCARAGAGVLKCSSAPCRHGRICVVPLQPLDSATHKTDSQLSAGGNLLAQEVDATGAHALEDMQQDRTRAEVR
jgi:hypothetical protein